MQGESSGIAYDIRVHTRAKSLKLTVYPDGRVVITVPTRVPVKARSALAATFVKERAVWIEEAKKKLSGTTIHTKEEIALYKKEALLVANARLKYFNTTHGFTYAKVSIRDQKTRWGSCSSKGAITFSYKIALLPKELQDYLVVHELCHLKEMNHSLRFWKLIEETIPDFKERRRSLRGMRL